MPSNQVRSFVRMTARAMGLGTIKPSTFCLAVDHVLARRTDKKMVWINASRIIAAMTHIHPRRYRAVVDLPRNAVSGYMGAADFHSTVRQALGRPRLDPVAGPFPTTPIVENGLDEAPKARFEGKGAMLVNAARHFSILPRWSLGLVLYLIAQIVLGPLVLRYVTWPAIAALHAALVR
jgi:hypothetical protein